MKVRALIVVAAVLLSQGCSRDRGVQAAEGQKARPVKVEPAQIRDVRRQVDVVGTLAALKKSWSARKSKGEWRGWSMISATASKQARH